ncbi:MAG: DNA internalization-related competence protein ComEC/Rec2 [Clostridia bacterium]|nr:DNA internalization-related competence protein ComEC/Rec2 [Clostridia bacterium]
MKILHKIAKFRTHISLGILAIIIVSISVTLYLNHYNQIGKNLNMYNEEIYISGKISSYPKEDDDTVSFYIKAETCDEKTLSGETVHITVIKPENKISDFGYGDRVSIRAKFNQGNEATNPGEFDYKNYLFSTGAVAKGTTDLENTKRIPAKNGLGKIIYDIRCDFIKNTHKYFSSRTGGLITAIISGDREGIDTATSDNLKMSGIYHIVAISGLHLNLFVFAITYFISRLRIKRLKKALLSLAATLLTGGFVLVFTGFGLSVWRAFIMMGISSISAIISRDYSAKNSLAISVFGIIVAMPYSLWNVGFLLSVTSTFSVLVSIDVMRYAKNVVNLEKFASSKTVNTAVISVMSVLFTLPVTMTSFGYITVYSWITNIFVLPVVPYLLGGSVIFAFLSAFGCELPASILAYALTTLAEYIFFIAQSVARLPGSTPAVNVVSASIVLAYIIAFILSIYTAVRKSIKSALLIIVIFSVAVGGFLKYNKDDPLIITYADVSQGDCTLIEIENSDIMIDCGTDSLNVEYSVQSILSILKNRGIDSLDMVLVTHYHSDHMNMIPQLIECGKVKRLYLPEYYDFREIEAIKNRRILLEASLKYNIPVEYLSDGMSMQFSNGTRMDILSPSADMFCDNNNMSTAIKLTYGKNKFIFCGDVQTEGIEKLLVKDIACDVLKIPHHGGFSEKCDEFIKRTNCKYAIISCGRNNTYGHPDERMSELLEKETIEVYQTGIRGAITIYADKNNIKRIETIN